MRNPETDALDEQKPQLATITVRAPGKKRLVIEVELSHIESLIDIVTEATEREVAKRPPKKQLQEGRGRRGKQWSAEDLHNLTKMVEEGLPTEDIARVLERSALAVVMKMQQLDIAPWLRRPTPQSFSAHECLSDR